MTRNWMSQAATALVLAAALGACSTEPAIEDETFVRPNLERLEPEVRGQIEGALEAVESLSADAAAADRGAAWGALGRLYDAYEYSTAAAFCYRRARDLAPEEFQWHYYAARLSRAAGDLDAADEALAEAARRAPEETVVRAELARLRLDQRRLDDAAELASELLAADAESAAGWLLQAEAAAESGDWELALSSYERLLALQPAATRLHQPAAIACRELGDDACARRHLALVGGGAPRLDDPWVQALRDLRSGFNSLLDRALTRYQNGDFAAAEALFAEAIAIEPESARARLDHGSALKDLGRLDEALAEFDEALRLEPGSRMAHYNRAVVLATQGDDEAALAAYDAALGLDPQYAEARFNRANLLRRMGRAAQALAAYEQLIADNPGNGAAHLGRAVCLVELGRESEALAALTESDSLFPRSPTFKNLMARLMATSDDEEVRDPARSLALAQRLVAAAATPEHVETLVLAQAALGDFDGALRNLRATLEALEAAGQSAAAARLESRLADLEAGRAPTDPGVD